MPPRSLSLVSSHSSAFHTARSSSPRSFSGSNRLTRRRLTEVVIHNHMPPAPAIPTKLPMVSVGTQTDEPLGPPDHPVRGWMSTVQMYRGRGWQVCKVLGQVCVSIALFFMPRINFGVGVRLDDLFFRPR